MSGSARAEFAGDDFGQKAEWHRSSPEANRSSYGAAERCTSSPCVPVCFPHKLQPSGHALLALSQEHVGFKLFSLISALPSSASADGCPPLFERPIGTISFSYGLLEDLPPGLAAIAFSRSPAGHSAAYGRVLEVCLKGLNVVLRRQVSSKPPRFSADGSTRVWGLRLRRTVQALALTRLCILPSLKRSCRGRVKSSLHPAYFDREPFRGHAADAPNHEPSWVIWLIQHER